MEKEKKPIFHALVVDDNEVNTLILENMLDLFSIRTDRVCQGSKAVALAEQKVYQIVLIDHIMPDMNGIQTVEAIRSISTGSRKPVIIALTSELSEPIIKQYRDAGADGIYEKPLGLIELTALLKQWCPEIKPESEISNQASLVSNSYSDKIKNMLQNLDGIDSNAGIQEAEENSHHIFHIMEASLKDLRACISMIVNSHAAQSAAQLKAGIHKLKNVLSSIGAKELLDSIPAFEKLIIQIDWIAIRPKSDKVINDMRALEARLGEALQKYSIAVHSEKKYIEYEVMSAKEYEHCLLSTIYYIRRYEYDNIIKELERLILKGWPQLKQEYESILRDVKEFNYEKALNCMLKIKNENGNIPEPVTEKLIKLENFWD